MEQEEIKGKGSGNIPQSPKDKIRSLERHPEVLGCVEQLGILTLAAMSAGQKYSELDVTGFVSKCPEAVDVRTMPRGWKK